MSTVEEIVEEVASGYRRYTSAFRKERAEEVECLAAVVDGIGYDNLSEDVFDLMDDLRGDLASQAANQFEDAEDQEAALSAVEEWFSDNVLNQSSEDVALAAFYLEGVQRSGALLAEIRSAAPQTSASL